MIIKSNMKEYSVIIEQSLEFVKKLCEVENAEFVIGHNVYRIYKHLFEKIPKDRLIIIEATEQNKIIDTALAICEKITEIPAKRNAVLVSFGGGIIQDITGFAANIMYRGIRWIFVPTTLLAACDSCIGGKTSLNYKTYKNLLGTFYPPDEIHICSDFFKSLEERDYESGLGEVVKFNLMLGENGLDRMERSIGSLLVKDTVVVNQFVESSLRFKKTFIENDEFDHGERVKLNFAHTFGHAIEVVSSYHIPHGTAVAIGMIMADRISFLRGYISEDYIKRSETLLLKVIHIDVNLLKSPVEQYFQAVKKDKKQIGDSLTTVLLTSNDGTTLSVVHDTKKEEIEEAIQYFIDLYEEQLNEN